MATTGGATGAGARTRAGRGRGRWRDPLSSRSFPLWFGVLAPPIAWGAQVALGDLLFELGCGSAIGGRDIMGLPLKAWGVILVAVALAVDVVAGVFAYRALHDLRSRSDGTAWDRAHALALAGVGSACVYGLVLAFGFLPHFFFQTCVTSL